MARDQLCGSMCSKSPAAVFFARAFPAMPRFLAVHAGACATDEKRPGVLPPELADGLKEHGAVLDSVRACGGDNDPSRR